MEGLLLQDKLRVGDNGDLGACRDLVAFLDRQPRDRAADARPRGKCMHGLDRADHGLLVGDVGAMDHESGVLGVGREEAGGRDDEGGDLQNPSLRFLDYILELLN